MTVSTRIYFEEYGSPQVLNVGTEELPEPAEGQARVEFRAVSVNPVDWQIVAGYLKQWFPLDFPAVPGCEAAGVVTGVGPAIEGYAIGDEVIWNGIVGGYRTEALVPADELTPLPVGIDFEQAACIPVAGGGAYSALKQLGVGEGDTILIHGAAGGVGSAAVQIAQAFGAAVIGTASESNHEYLSQLGALPVTYGAGLVERVKAQGRVTAVFDTVGTNESVAATLELLKDPHRAVTTVPSQYSGEAGIATVQLLEGRVLDVATLAAEGQITFTISHRMPLIEAPDALAISRSGHVRGKIVLLP
jgi:NADPH:quinone reductase-like Zn-dependent oxidoreductase